MVRADFLSRLGRFLSVHCCAFALCAGIAAEVFAQQPVAAYGQFLTDNSPSPLPPAPAATNEFIPSQPAAKLASYPRDFTEPLLDQPDNFVLLPEVQQP